MCKLPLLQRYKVTFINLIIQVALNNYFKKTKIRNICHFFQNSTVASLNAVNENVDSVAESDMQDFVSSESKTFAQHELPFRKRMFGNATHVGMIFFLIFTFL